MNKNKLITALRIAANSILSGNFCYSWTDNTRCNCGILACSLLNVSPAVLTGLMKATEIPKNARIPLNESGTWTNRVAYHCPLTGFSNDTIFNAFKEAGLQRDDIHDLEYLANPKVLSRMKKRTRTWTKHHLFGKDEVFTKEINISFEKAEDVANYMLAWADILTEENALDIGSGISTCTCRIEVRRVVAE
jgi:hypothetical protein